MRTAVINIKTDAKIKAQAQKVASKLGFSLSGLINAYLRHLVKSKTVYFSLSSEEPTRELLQMLAESEADRKAGRVVSFEDAEKAIKYLDKIISDEQQASKN
jgi:addiction module RelB/DinJ family antitoxin